MYLLLHAYIRYKNVVSFTTLSLLVETTTYGATSDDSVVELTTFCFRRCCLWLTWINLFMGSANWRWVYNETSPLVGWCHIQHYNFGVGNTLCLRRKLKRFVMLIYIYSFRELWSDFACDFFLVWVIVIIVNLAVYTAGDFITKVDVIRIHNLRKSVQRRIIGVHGDYMLLYGVQIARSTPTTRLGVFLIVHFLPYCRV